MSITQKEKIDIIGIENGNTVVLTISDHLDWKDSIYHLRVLEDKINTYLEFIEGGQILEDYPDSLGKQLVIDIASKYPYCKEGLVFIEKAKVITKTFNVELRQTYMKL